MNEAKAGIDTRLDLIITRMKRAGSYDYFVLQRLQFLRELFFGAEEPNFSVKGKPDVH